MPTLPTPWTKRTVARTFKKRSTLFESLSMIIKWPRLISLSSSGLPSKFPFINRSALLSTLPLTKSQSKLSRTGLLIKSSTLLLWISQVSILKQSQPLKKSLPSLILPQMENKLELERIKDKNPKLLPVSYCTWWNGKAKDLECLHPFLLKLVMKTRARLKSLKISQISFLILKLHKRMSESFSMFETQDCSKKH